MASKLAQTYNSPRWSGEITDCSMPMVLDTYSRCSYKCLYCFAFFQKAIGRSAKSYGAEFPTSLNVKKVKRIFTDPDSSQFGGYVKRRIAMQWGGMSDPFDEYEREYGVTLELLKFFREIEYPICFSTKGTWWTQDPRYVEVFKGASHLNVKVSIVTLNESKAARIEVGVPTPLERLDAIERIASWGCGGATLRLRPFLIGASDRTARELILEAGARGATALSTEFYCLEQRSKNPARDASMSKTCGFDLRAFYRAHSSGSGYLRLNRKIKEPYILAMQQACSDAGMRFYVSDAHFKELCHNGSCCGLDESWNYAKGQLCEALQIAKRDGEVRWHHVSDHCEDYLGFDWSAAEGFNTMSAESRAKFYGFSMLDYLRYLWNDVNGRKSPYKYTEGILLPNGTDENGDVIYRYAGADLDTK